MTVKARAEQRFEGLRAKALASYSFDPASAEAPPGWCIGAIARLKANNPSLIAGIQSLQHRLEPIGKAQYYPGESMHISLLGCTQREATKQKTISSRAAAIGEVVQKVIAGHSSVRMELGRINIMGTQLFIEVLTDQESWSQMRSEVGQKLIALGEEPIIYADTEPMHLNIARLLSVPDPDFLRTTLADETFALNKSLSINTIELVVTDFVVSPDTLEVIGAYKF